MKKEERCRVGWRNVVSKSQGLHLYSIYKNKVYDHNSTILKVDIIKPRVTTKNYSNNKYNKPIMETKEKQI